MTAGVVLAIGLGATIAMYGAVERLLLGDPPHVQGSAEVRRILTRFELDGRIEHRSALSFTDHAAAASALGSDRAAAFATRRLLVRIGSGPVAERPVLLASGGYWSLLGTRPALGRFFDTADDRLGADPVVVLSWAMWQREFGGDANVLGVRIVLEDVAHTVVGVAPQRFSGTDPRAVDAFVPLVPTGTNVQGTASWMDNPDWQWLRVVVRVPLDLPAAALEHRITSLYRNLHADAAEQDATVLLAPLRAARGVGRSGEAAVAVWLLALSAALLLTACLNAAGLLLARSLARQHERDIRLALGIPRLRLIAEALVEGVAVGVIGGLGALLIAAVVTEVLRSLLAPDLDWSNGPSHSALALLAILALVAGLVSAAPAALRAWRFDSAHTLLAGRTGGRIHTRRTWGAIAVSQTAFTVLLLCGAGTFLRSMRTVRSADYGVDVWDLAFAEPVYRDAIDADGRTRHLEAAADRARAVPGVIDVAIVSSVPFRSAYSTELRVDGAAQPAVDMWPSLVAVDQHYFRVVGLELQQGRTFQDSDTRTSRPVAVVSRGLARLMWGSDESLGRCLYIGSDATVCTEVVGVVADARQHSLLGGEDHVYYVPLAQHQRRREPTALLIRTGGNPQETVIALRDAIAGPHPDVKWVAAAPLADLVDGEIRPRRLGATLLTAFGLLALAVAAAGHYALFAFEVGSRKHEIGVRTALGATAGSNVRLMLARALVLSLAGVGAGVALTLLGLPVVQTMLNLMDATDLVTLLTVAAVLVLTCMLAAAAPAWRISKIQPGEALRSG